jgi:SAM-dependent methyltransferase
MNAYVYQPNVERTDYDRSVLAIAERYPVRAHAIDNVSDAAIAKVAPLAEAAGMELTPLAIDVLAYRDYYARALYDQRYPDYYVGNRPEKTLEHFIALTLLDIKPGEVFVDIASEHSPVPEIYERLTGARSYSQDIMYPEGISGNQIGGDACAMPVKDSFFQKAALTCSLEHFEGEADRGLFEEMHRVLSPGGKICITPFYLHHEEGTQTDPTLSVPAGVSFDETAIVYCARGWNNRHGRFYTPQSFMRRIGEPMKGKFDFAFYRITNPSEVDPTTYVRYAFVATRI